MSKQHDTGIFTAQQSDGMGEVRVCQAHRETLKDIYEAIKEVGKTKVSWRYATLLCSIAVIFGLALWAWTEYRTSQVETNARDIIKIRADLEYLKAGQVDAREELKLTRAESRQSNDKILEELKRLREMIKNAN